MGKERHAAGQQKLQTKTSDLSSPETDFQKE